MTDPNDVPNVRDLLTRARTLLRDLAATAGRQMTGEQIAALLRWQDDLDRWTRWADEPPINEEAPRGV